MAESNYKWYVLRAIGGKENKVKEYIEGALVTSSLFSMCRKCYYPQRRW